MNFYHILFGLQHGFNRNLTWYENLFVKFYNNTIAKLVAKILKIKGHTISFNQLVQNGNFVDTSNWVAGAGRGTLSASNNELTYTFVTMGVANVQNRINTSYVMNTSAGHKYYLKYDFYSNKSNYAFATVGNDFNAHDMGYNSKGSFKTLSAIFTAINGNQTYEMYLFSKYDDYSVGDSFKVRNVMLFDLTLMGIDNLTTTAEVENWLSTNIGTLPYYDYIPGKLISFNGTGLKTVGFNQWDEEWELGTYSASTGNKTSSSENIRSKNKIRIFPNTVYYAQFSSGAMNGIYFYGADGTFLGSSYTLGKSTPGTFTSPSNAYYLTFQMNATYGTTYNNDICINISDADKNGTYEPYTSNTLSLPISTYFPTGMKSAGSIYDELTPSKATTRIGSVASSSNDWVLATGTNAGGLHYVTYDNANIKMGGNGVSSMLPLNNTSAWSSTVPCFQITSSANRIRAYGTFTSLAEFQSQYADLVINYELTTPTETTISPELDLTYPIEWGGTEQILPTNTSTPTTSAIVADIHYPDGDRTDQTFVYRVIEKVSQLGNRALSIMLGKSVKTDNPEEPLNILLKGEK